MSDRNESQFVPTAGEKVVMLVFGIVGYLIGSYIRGRMGYVGAVPGAIAGGLGTGAGVLVAVLLIKARRSSSR